MHECISQRRRPVRFVNLRILDVCSACLPLPAFATTVHPRTHKRSLKVADESRRPDVTTSSKAIRTWEKRIPEQRTFLLENRPWIHCCTFRV